MATNPKPIANSFQPQAQGLFSIGQEVHHRIFGDGTVIDCEGDGDDMKVKVCFAKVGTKQLIAGFLEGK